MAGERSVKRNEKIYKSMSDDCGSDGWSWNIALRNCRGSRNEKQAGRGKAGT